MKRFYIKFILILFIIGCSWTSTAQIKRENFRLGFNYGSGSQNKFPFNLSHYTHEVDFYQAQINYLWKDKRKWSFEFNLEPAYYVAEHQLLHKWYIRPDDSEDYLELRELHTQKRTIKEYALNLGLLARYKINKKFSVYSIGSVGPMISDKATERLAKGFAFSDVLGFGTSYKISNFTLDIRYSVRHTSNFEIVQPNAGHNTINLQMGVMYDIYN